MTQSHKLFVLKRTHRALRVGAGGVMGGGTPRCYQLAEMDSHLPPGGPSNPTSNHKNSHTFVNSVTVYIDCSFTPAIWSRPVQTNITLVCYFYWLLNTGFSLKRGIFLFYSHSRTGRGGGCIFQSCWHNAWKTTPLLFWGKLYTGNVLLL